LVVGVAVPPVADLAAAAVVAFSHMETLPPSPIRAVSRLLDF
jgi:hypothetical protein